MVHMYIIYLVELKSGRGGGQSNVSAGGQPGGGGPQEGQLTLFIKYNVLFKGLFLGHLCGLGVI